MPDSVPGDLLARLEAVQAAWIDIGGRSRKKVAADAERVFFDALGPLAVELVRLHPTVFPDPGNPPPYDPTKGITERIAGTHRTDIAGRRITFWAAAIREPVEFHRSVPSGRDELKDWARRWMIYKDRPRHFRASHQPMDWVDGEVKKAIASAPNMGGNHPDEPVLDELVTLDQVAPLTGLSKRTLERHLRQGNLSPPDVPGGGGKAHKWFWANLKGSLSKVARRPMPERFPGSRII
jgi:hypothetical protein